MSEEQRRGEATSRSITPLTIREFTAPAAMRGYDRETVDEFLQEVAGSYEAVVNDLDKLERRVLELESLLDESEPAWADETDGATSMEVLRHELRTYREREHAVGSALLVAQKAASELRSNAEQEADAIRTATAEEILTVRSAAREEAESIVLEAHREAKKIEEEVSAERSVFEEELDRLRSLKEATRQDLSEFLSQALRGLESSDARNRAPESESSG
jgi:DivIVA domain-containing protein